MSKHKKELEAFDLLLATLDLAVMDIDKATKLAKKNGMLGHGIDKCRVVDNHIRNARKIIIQLTYKIQRRVWEDEG